MRTASCRSPGVLWELRFQPAARGAPGLKEGPGFSATHPPLTTRTSCPWEMGHRPVTRGSGSALWAQGVQVGLPGCLSRGTSHPGLWRLLPPTGRLRADGQLHTEGLSAATGAAHGGTDGLVDGVQQAGQVLRTATTSLAGGRPRPLVDCPHTPVCTTFPPPEPSCVRAPGLPGTAGLLLGTLLGTLKLDTASVFRALSGQWSCAAQAGRGQCAGALRPPRPPRGIHPEPEAWRGLSEARTVAPGTACLPDGAPGTAHRWWARHSLVAWPL